VDEFVAQIDAGDTNHANGHAFYMLQDANFNVMALVNSAGAVVEQYTYEPYGAVVAVDPAPCPFNRIGHQGLFYEPLDGGPGLAPGSIGLYYNRNRWYSPALGRFISRDPNETAMPIINAVSMAGARFTRDGSTPDIRQHLADGLNLYQYLRSGVTRSCDPLGLAENHLYPLYLGGAPDGPGFVLEGPDHTDFHESIHAQLGHRYGDEAREAWQGMDTAQHRIVLTNAASRAGVDVTDPVFLAGLEDAIRTAKPGTNLTEARRSVRLINVRRAERSAATRLVRGVSGLDRLRSIGIGIAVVGGVMQGLNMMNALDIGNEYVRDMALITQKARRGSMTMLDEVFVLHDLYQLTNDPFAAAWGWNYWENSIGN
jgi:RHS repeat-associated protein